MTPAQLDQMQQPATQVPAPAVDAAVESVEHLRSRSSEWWKAMRDATGLRVSEILEQIGDEIDDDDAPTIDVEGIIALNLGK